MKVRLFPEKTLVTSIIQERIGEQGKLLAEDETKLHELTSGQLKIIRPGQKEVLEASLDQRKQYISQLENQLKLLDAHKGTEVMTELEV